jgi:hypothetical protein
MNSKRRRNDEEQVGHVPLPSTTARVLKLRLSDELAIKLGTRYYQARYPLLHRSSSVQ